MKDDMIIYAGNSNEATKKKILLALIDILEMLSLPIHEHGVSSYISICIYFPQQYFTIFSILHIFCQVYAKVFYIG